MSKRDYDPKDPRIRGDKPKPYFDPTPPKRHDRKPYGETPPTPKPERIMIGPGGLPIMDLEKPKKPTPYGEEGGPFSKAWESIMGGMR